jgi:hypothetical protein
VSLSDKLDEIQQAVDQTMDVKVARVPSTRAYHVPGCGNVPYDGQTLARDDAETLGLRPGQCCFDERGDPKEGVRDA